jgi:hypothetical protein
MDEGVVAHAFYVDIALGPAALPQDSE